MKRFPFLSTPIFLVALRIAIALFMTAHGCIRIYAETVSGFGGFLESFGFPFGVAIAWMITIFEIAGGIALALNYFRKVICAAFILEHLMGILLVHAPNGWFVVGYTSGGAEYSVLLILCFLVVASDTKK